MPELWTFVLIWGVWLVTPIVIDGVDTLLRLLTVATAQRRRSRLSSRSVSDDALPTVSLIIPAHNEAQVIDRCLESVKAQDYPSDKLQVIVIDDGSTDDTADRVEDHIYNGGERRARTPEGDLVWANPGYVMRGRTLRLGKFAGRLDLIRNGHGGKAAALNAGLRASNGEILVNIDSDVVLAPDCVRRIAEEFVRDPGLGAATGNIKIDWTMIEARDSEGHLRLDDDGCIVSRELTTLEALTARAQFHEYLHSFRLGRQAQADTGTVYTLAGACSAFRRDVLHDICAYSDRTVSEDTDLTLDLHGRDVAIGFAADAKVHLEPVVDWDALYAQRVRWARGQLEVCSTHRRMVASRGSGLLGWLALPQMLITDHTTAFPRLLWTPLLLVFPAFGYSWGTLAAAAVSLYLFYLLIEVVNTLACYAIVDEETRALAISTLWVLPVMPLYRFVVFHFRLSGYLATLTEPQQWSMRGPIARTRSGMESARLRTVQWTSVMGLWLRMAGSMLTWFLAWLTPLLVAFLVGGERFGHLIRRRP